MTTLSTGPLSVSPNVYQGVYTPFVLYGELKQTNAMTYGGNRWERIHAMDKAVNLMELTLKNEAIDVAPVKSTRAFGNTPARVTINGNWGTGSRVDITNGTKPPAKIAEDVERINANELRTGVGSQNAADLFPDPAVDDLVNDIKTWFEGKIGSYIDVMAVEVHGILYGRNGRHFPKP